MAQGTTKGVPIDVDPLLALDSDLVVPSQKAIKAYVDAKKSAADSDYVNISGDTMIGSLILSADPLATYEAATKNYVDNFINGLDYKTAAHVGTVAALPAYTVSVSKLVLTGTSNGPIPTATFDNHDPLIGERVLIKNETSTLTPNNGIYALTQVGNGSTPFILTRATDANTPANLSQATLNVIYGDTLANSQWHCSPAAFPIVIGTTYITFVQVGSGVYSATAPVFITGNVISMPAATSLIDGYLTAADRAIFIGKQDAITNTLSLGTPGPAGTTGQLIFRNSTNANTLTLQSGASSSSYSLTFPIAAPTAGQYLQFSAAGVATWVAGTVNGVTIVGTFSTSAQTNGATIASSTITFGPASATVPGMVSILAQTWAGAKTFQAQVNIGNTTYAASILAFGGTTSNWISFPTYGDAIPTVNLSFNAVSVGTRLIVAPIFGGTSTNYAIGYSLTQKEMWLSAATPSGSRISFYSGNTRFAWFGDISAGAFFNGLYLGETTTVGYLRLNSTTSNLIYFENGGAAIPSTTTTRSLGSKIVIKESLGAGTDYAI
jgi:hypothetical protein